MGLGEKHVQAHGTILKFGPEGLLKSASLMSVILAAPIEARTMPAPTSKLLDEREFAIDSGTSMHMLRKRDLTSDEMETLRRSRTPTVEVQTNQEAQVYVHNLGLFVTVQ